MKKLMFVAVVLAIGLIPHAFAKPEFLDAFNGTYSFAVGSKIDNCSLCHINGVPGGPRNLYGSDFESQINKGLQPADALKAIENNDSDQKGFTHIQEIKNLNFPGNPNDLPSNETSANETSAETFNITGFKLNGTGENETGIPNWTIMLFDSNGTKIATTTTEGDGWYSFTDLANGTYNVTEQLMQGWTNITPTTQEVVIDGSDESDVNFTNMVTSAEVPSTFNISGFKLNGTDESDIGIENWNIMLLDNNGTQIATTETEADGSYNFTDLSNGTYIVKEGTMQGWTNISPMIQEVVIDNVDESDVNFTNMLSTVAPLNITSESPESPFVSNVNESATFEIKLNQVANVSWNLDGMSVENEDNTMLSDYTNDNASLGQHTLDVNASNSNGEDSFEWIWTVQNVAPSVENVGIISGIVFNDKNHNGKKDKGEKGISGINVTLKGLDPSNKAIVLSKKTDKNGKYTFKNLSMGHYKIILGHKKGFKPTTGTSKKVDLIPKITVNFGDRKH